MNDEPSTNPRPVRGLKIEEALERWSDPAGYAAMMEYGDAAADNPPKGWPAERYPEYQQRHAEYVRLRKPLEEAQQERLVSGELGASGIRRHGVGREFIITSLFDVVWIDYEFGEIVGPDWEFVSPEIFDPAAIPTNIDEPEWLRKVMSDAEVSSAVSALSHDASYRHVIVGDLGFRFGPVQAKVVRMLHVASMTDQPWRSGKDLLAEAGSNSLRLSDVFKSQNNWQDLIESDERGDYRLRVGTDVPLSSTTA